MMVITKLYHRYQNSVELTAGSWYLVGVFADKFILFLGVPIFARLLTTEQFGTVSIFMNWLSIFATVLTLNVAASVINAKFDFNSQQFNQFVSSILSLGLLTCGVGFGVLLVLPADWITAVFNMSRPLVLLAIAGSATTLPYNVVLDVWRARYEYRLFNLSKILLSAGSIVLSFILIVFPPFWVTDYDPALGRILGVLLVNLVFGSILLQRRLAAGKVYIRREYWAYALGISLPLIIHTVSAVLLSRFDQLLIDRYIGRSATGIYSLAYRIGDVTTMVWFATNSVWTVWFYRQMKAGNAALIRRRANQYILGFAGVTIILMILGPILLHILAPEPYWSASNIVSVIMLGGFFTHLYSIYANVEFYEKKTGYIPLATGFSAIVTIVLNIVLLWLSDCRMDHGGILCLPVSCSYFYRRFSPWPWRSL
jgi:O-antigen/teichoic acid export membrane protein